MIYKVELLKGVNELKFGMDREAVRKILGDYKNLSVGHLANRDMFANCFAEYDEDKLISIATFGEFIVDINGIVLKSSDNEEEAFRKLLLIDPDIEIETDIATSYKYSLGAYFENGFESLLFGKENYYNNNK